jgi:hypothetical protein
MALTKTVSDKKTICKPKVCHTCGGQECFERPRYFCGQLLTDKDLDAAQRYVIEKNKLHNRYLVGSGVVCGLAVRCVPCDKCTVTIEPGYAIDCCGNDIVLCEPAPFNVCEYIEKCFREKEPACEDMIRLPSRCDDQPKEYCLILSYDEEHARPMTALIRDNGCNVSRCEPSRTKETFRLDLVEKKDDQDLTPQLSLWDKLRDCVTKVYPQLTRFVAEFSVAEAKLNQNQDLNAFHTTVFVIFCRMKAYILELYKKGPNVRCNLATELNKIEESFPPFTEDRERRATYLQQVYTAVFRMWAYILQFMIDCICDALLVPCTECDEQEGVLLACLTIQGGKIEKICNMARRQVVSGPALRYWLQPLYTNLGNQLESLCCEFDVEEKFAQIFQPREKGFTERVGASFRRSEAAFRTARDFWKNLKIFDLLQFVSPGTLMAVDIYNQPVEKVKTTLEEKGVTVVHEKRVTAAEAYTLRNLAEMSWTISPGTKEVELVIDQNEKVTCIRVLKEEKQ